MVLDITEIKFFFIVLELNKVEYPFSFFLFLCFVQNFYLFHLHCAHKFFKITLSPYFLWDFTSYSLAEWPLLLFLHLFLLFFISHSWQQITINATHLPWLCFSHFPFSFGSPLGPIALMHQPISFLLFLLACPTK